MPGEDKARGGRVNQKCLTRGKMLKRKTYESITRLGEMHKICAALIKIRTTCTDAAN